MTNKNKRSGADDSGAKTGITGVIPSLTTSSIPRHGKIDNTQNTFYDDLLARLAELERRGAIIDARLAELDLFYTGDLDAETEHAR